MNLYIIFNFCILFQVVIAKSNEDQVENRIYNGNVATSGQFPYQGYLTYNSIDFKCGGSVIHSRWVLIAAHCIFDMDWPLFTVGTTYLFGSDGFSYGVERYHIHEYFGQQVLGASPYTQGKNIATYDIALIRTATDIQFGYNVQPIPLARDYTANLDYQTAVMTGWGWSQYGLQPSSNLLYAYVPIVPLSECDAAMQFYTSYELHLCATNAYQQQACPGDSGSPVVWNGEQIGIISVAHHGCVAQEPTLLTKVSSFIPWIQGRMGMHNDYI